MNLPRQKGYYRAVTIKVCADGSVIRFRRCLQCDKLIIFRPCESVRQVCDRECKRALFYARHKVSTQSDYKAKLAASKV